MVRNRNWVRVGLVGNLQLFQSFTLIYCTEYLDGPSDLVAGVVAVRSCDRENLGVLRLTTVSCS